MTTTVHHLDRDEGRIAYTLDGPDDAPLVVLLPGMGDTRSTWRELTGPLLAEGYRVAVADLRGQGDSDLTFRTFGDVATAQDAIALVEHLGGPAVLVGHSMSAGAAAWAAAERPDLVAGLALSGPFLRDPSGNRGGGAARIAFQAVFVPPWGAFAWTSYYRSPLHRGAQQPWLDEHVAELRASYRSRARLRQLRRLAGQLTHAVVEARLAEVDAPTIAFVGALDPDFPDPRAEATWIRSALDAQVVLVDDAAHYPHAQRADVVVPEVLGFLAGLPREVGGWAPAQARA
ncbi:alpha/beta fold hydrolase [Cellulomonas composti]|uniref:Hydrolase n=1 Tax=Cellulomonas composti TaxID=266130 RepID=A0A511J705_9CELL|nr:alpha/beta hydrolase [Cellulomonas composti]GEL93764.1 hydrolase [Cellulomonas composti]